MTEEEKKNKFGIIDAILYIMFCTGIALITMAAIYYYGAGAMAFAGVGLCFLAAILWSMIVNPVTPRLF